MLDAGGEPSEAEMSAREGQDSVSMGPGGEPNKFPKPVAISEFTAFPSQLP